MDFSITSPYNSTVKLKSVTAKSIPAAAKGISADKKINDRYFL